MSEAPDPSKCPISCNSWVVTKGEHSFETWDADVARGAVYSGATVQTAYDYLVSINENSKDAGSEPPKRATFDEVWAHLRQFMPDDFTTQQAIIVMDGFGWIDNGPCTCGLEIYGDPCPHHSQNQANGTTLTPKT